LPLGLNFLQLDHKKTYELIKKYIEIAEPEGKETSFFHNHDILDLIFTETNGHISVIHTLLFHLVTMDTVLTLHPLVRKDSEDSPSSPQSLRTVRKYPKK